MKVVQKGTKTNYWQRPRQSKICIVDELPHLSSWIWNVTFCKHAADVLTVVLQAHLLPSLSSGKGKTFTLGETLFSTVGVKWTKTNDPSWLWPFTAYSVWETGRVDTVGLLCCHLPRSSVPARHHGWNVLQIFNRLTPIPGWTQKTQNWFDPLRWRDRRGALGQHQRSEGGPQNLRPLHWSDITSVEWCHDWS